MAGYAARRVLAAIPVLLFVSFVTFALVRLAPGDPVLIVLGGKRISPQLIEQLRHAVRADRRSDHPVRGMDRAGAPGRPRPELQAQAGCQRPDPGPPAGHLRAHPVLGAPRGRGGHPAGRLPGIPAGHPRRLRGLALRAHRGQLPGLLHGHPRGAGVRGRAGRAAGVRTRWSGPAGPGAPPAAAGRDPRPGHDRAHLAHDPERHDRGALLRLHRGGPRQGPAGADDRGQARAAQRAHPGAHRDLAPGRVPARGHGPRREHPRPRRPGLAHHRLHPEP